MSAEGRSGAGRGQGGVIHTYLRYDPARFPPPMRAGDGDFAEAAFDHLLQYGSRRSFTEEELRRAIRIDPSDIAGFGPSIEALIALLEERRRRILAAYDPETARDDAEERVVDEVDGLDADGDIRDRAKAAAHDRQIQDLDALWYELEDRDPPAAGAVLRVKEALGDLFQIDTLRSKYRFTGRDALSVEQAIGIKEELETIDRLLEQLREARENAEIGVIDLDELRRFVDEADVEQLSELEERIGEYLRRRAEEEGLELERGAFAIGPRAYRLFQSRLLDEIFGDLREAMSGRHGGPIIGEGVTELERTRGYEFGDSPTHIDLPATVLNAGARGARQARAEDIEIRLTKNHPKCATCVLMDMSGSMRHWGQYVHCKRMALALQGLIMSEFPGDHLSFIEMFSLARQVAPGELVELMPKPVTIHEPWVRLRADLADPDISEMMIPPHFTNIQQGLQMARRILGAQNTENRQVVLITDGLPTAHVESGPDGERFLYLLYPPDPLTERETMREAMACRREGVTINIFLVPSWSQDEDDIAFAHRLAEQTRGRVFFTGGEDLDRFVLWDYVRNRRRIIG